MALAFLRQPSVGQERAGAPVHRETNQLHISLMLAKIVRQSRLRICMVRASLSRLRHNGHCKAISIRLLFASYAVALLHFVKKVIKNFCDDSIW